MFNRIYKFLNSDFFSLLAIGCCAIAMLVVGIYVGATSVVIKTNECENNIELVKQGAKQGVHEFLNEFGLEYRKKSK